MPGRYDERLLGQDLDDFREIEVPPDRVEGDLSQSGLVFVYGTPSSGKTTWLLHLLMHVATGTEWLGNSVLKSRVLYILAEGQLSFPARVKALREAMGESGSKPVYFKVIDFGPDLARQSEDLIHTHKANGGVEIIVLDTLKAVLPHAQENSDVDMAEVVSFARLAERELGALVIFVHHEGKTPGKGMRGHSSLTGAADQIFLVEKRGTGSRVVVEKDRYREHGKEWHFEIQGREVGLNKEGKPITAPVAVFTDRPAPEPTGKWQNEIVRALGDAEQMSKFDLVAKVKAATTHKGGKDRRGELINTALKSMGDLLEVREGVIHVL